LRLPHLQAFPIHPIPCQSRVRHTLL
jgi:hypothetical protein